MWRTLRRYIHTLDDAIDQARGVHVQTSVYSDQRFERGPHSKIKFNMHPRAFFSLQRPNLLFSQFHFSSLNVHFSSPVPFRSQSHRRVEESSKPLAKYIVTPVSRNKWFGRFYNFSLLLRLYIQKKIVKDVKYLVTQISLKRIERNIFIFKQNLFWQLSGA